MSKNYFDAVCQRIMESVKADKFKSLKSDDKKVLLQGEEETYEISYNEKNKRISLIKVLPEGNKQLSSWLLDEEGTTQKDIKMISEDFLESIGTKVKTVNRNSGKKNTNEESNVTGLFFANRMVNIFPDIKQAIYIEKECYSEFRAVKFTREIILPRVNELLRNEKSSSALIKKLGKLLSDLYSNGTKDVRSIITMVILNYVENASPLQECISEELKKAWENSLKYKGKEVKPEKLKKRSSLMSRALEYQNQQEK